MSNPTRTKGITKRWIAEDTRRYRLLAKRINNLLLRGDDGGIPVPFVDPITLQPIANQFEFTSDPVAVMRFMAWLQLQIDAVIIGNDATPQSNWQNKYINQSYLRGVEISKAQLRALGITAAQFQGIAAAEIVGTAQASLLAGLTFDQMLALGPLHLEAIRTIYTRDFTQLRGITDTMSQQIARVLTDGIEQGLPVREIARNITDRVDKIGLTRSKLLARTETVRSYNIGVINEGVEFSELTGEEKKYKWKDSDYGRVRPVHKERDGNIYDEQTALRLIGEPNCRCALQIHIDEEDLAEAA
jgi:SPP1 gp7 family putative phage head morphogenesis protein